MNDERAVSYSADKEIEAMIAFARPLSGLARSAQLRCVAFFVSHFSYQHARALYDLSESMRDTEETPAAEVAEKDVSLMNTGADNER